jgi:NADH-quinone oxidoreductase subunit A
MTYPENLLPYGAYAWRGLAYFACVVLLVAAMLVLSYLLGQRHRQPATGDPYESGVVSTGSARLRFDVRFYLVAVAFVIFDLEAVFLFAWAVAIRPAGWAGFIEAAVFVGVLLAGLAYLLRAGGLDWGGPARAGRRSPGADGRGS